jgi:hypothetical protein
MRRKAKGVWGDPRQGAGDIAKNLVAHRNHATHFFIRNSNGSLKLQMGSGTDGAGVDHVPPVPLRAVSLPPKQRNTTLRRRRNRTQDPTCRWLLWWCSEAIGPYWRVAMVLTAIVVSGLVFTGIGAVIGYILGYVEAENFYRIKHREKP